MGKRVRTLGNEASPLGAGRLIIVWSCRAGERGGDELVSPQPQG
jgi:hypothetical protein